MQGTAQDSRAIGAPNSAARTIPPALVLTNGGRSEGGAPGAHWANPRELRPGNSSLRGRSGPEHQLALALRADDPITADGAAAYFQSGQQPVRLLPAHQSDQAEVLLILVRQVTDETLSWMRQAAESSGPHSRIVLVADSITELQLLRAVGYGLTGFLQRELVGFARVLQAVLNSRDGRAELPDTLMASLVAQLRTVQNEGSAPKGLTPREAEVLRHLADGLDTTEIASRLSYSERTIKNIIHGMITRYELRNRAHAVAHAIRAGLI